MSALADLYVILSLQNGQFTAGLEESAAAGEEFTGKMSAGFRETADSAKELGASATESLGAAGDATERLAGLEQELAAATTEAEDAQFRLAMASREATGAGSEYQAALDANTAATDRLMEAQIRLGEAELEAAGRGQEAADGQEAAAAKTDEAGAAADTAGGHFKLMGLAALAGTAIAVKMAGDYQQSMTRLVTSAGESRQNLALVSQGVLQLSTATNTSTKQLAAGMYYVESAGFHGAEGLKVLRAAAEGAQAEGADLATVANAVTSGLNAYGLGASHATSFTNQMVVAVGRGKMTMQDLAESISTVLPAAAKAGLSFAQVGGAISTMTAQGMSAQQATLDLRHTILSLQTPTSVQVTEMQQLGINSNELAKNLGKTGLTGTITQLEETVLKGMGPAGMVLLKSFNQSRLAAQSAQRMIASMPPSLQRLAHSYEDGAISSKGMRTALYALSGPQANVMKQFETTTNAAHGFNNQLKAGGGNAQTFTSALSKMMGGTTGLQTALMVGGAHMATYRANTDAIAAAASHGGQNVQNWALIQHNFNFQLGQAGKAVQAAAISFGQALLPAATAVMHVLATLGSWLARNTAASKVLAVVVGVLLAGALEHGLAKALKTCVSGFQDVGDAVRKTAGFFRAGEDGVSKFGSIMAGIRNTASTAWSGVAAAWSGAGAFFSKVGSGISAGVSAIREWSIWSKIAAAGTRMLEIAQAGLDAVMAANPIFLIIAAIVALVAIFAILWLKCSAFRDFWKAVWKDVTAAAVAAWHFIDDNMIHPLEHGIDDLVSWVRSHWKLLATILATVLLGPIGGLIMFVATHWQQFTQLTSRLIGDVTSFFRSLPGKILAALAALPGEMLSLGKSIVEGLINGVKDMVGAAVSAAKSVGSAIVGGIKGLLGISSPSKVMQQIGLQIADGLIKGLTGSASQVKSAAGLLATDVKDALTAGMIGQAGATSLTRFIEHDNTRLQDLANKRTRILKEMATAAKFATTTAQAAEQQYGVVNAAGGGTAPATAASILATLRTDLTAIRTFKANIAKLQKMGLNKAYISQIIAAGPVAGGQIAQELASGSWSQIQQINTVESQITGASKSLGKTAADALYDSGKDAGHGFLSGLREQEKSIEAVMRRIARTMVDTIRRELGIRSPSTVMRQHGQDAAAGFALGIEDGITGTAAASKRLASAVATGAAGGGGAGGGTVIHIEPHITVQGFIGSEQQLVEKLLPPLQQVVLEVNRRNPGTGNGLSLGTAAGRAA